MQKCLKTLGKILGICTEELCPPSAILARLSGRSAAW